MFPREPTSRDRHLVHFTRSSCPFAGDNADREKHVRVQYALVELGKSMGEPRAAMEWGVQNARYRFDVVWPKAKIAWEVDLSQNTPDEQRIRQAVRRQHGFRMISVVESLQTNRAREIPTVRIKGLCALGEGHVPLQKKWVQNLERYDDSGNRRVIEKTEFARLIRGLLTEEIVYAELPRLHKAEPWYESSLIFDSAKYKRFRWIPRRVHEALPPFEENLLETQMLIRRELESRQTIGQLANQLRETASELKRAEEALHRSNKCATEISALVESLAAEGRTRTSQLEKHRAIAELQPLLESIGLGCTARVCMRVFPGVDSHSWAFGFLNGRRSDWFRMLDSFVTRLRTKVAEFDNDRQQLETLIGERFDLVRTTRGDLEKYEQGVTGIQRDLAEHRARHEMLWERMRLPSRGPRSLRHNARPGRSQTQSSTKHLGTSH